MIGPWCVVSKFPAVFILFTTLPGILQAEIHRCLREFEPSNCNALEEVWAFDAHGQKCIEVVYGGCGKPKHLSNRFESHDECMASCGQILAESGSQGTESTINANVMNASTSDEPSLGSGRTFYDFTPVNMAKNNPSDNVAALENIQNALNYLDTTIGIKQPPLNVQQFPGNPDSTAFGWQIQPISEQSQRQIYVQQAKVLSAHGQGQLYGTDQRPFPYSGQTYGGQPQGYVGQPQGYVVPQGYVGLPFPGGFVQPPVFGGQVRGNPFYGQPPLLNNPPAVLNFGPQAVNRRPPGPIQYLQNILSGLPRARGSARK